jgi:ribosomal protein S18 acetylase RimI-like enzyme
MSDLDRCTAFLRDFAFRTTGRTDESRFGPVFIHERLPRVWSLNYLLAERELDETSAADLAAEADQVLGAAAGVRHRKVEVWNEAAGLGLEPGFRKLGWTVERDVVMTHRRAPDRETETESIEEVSAEELADAWAAGIRTEPWGQEEEVVRQLVGHKYVYAAAGARFFAARSEGGVSSYCELYTDGRTGQIEAVMTLPEFRNRGLARAVVSKALAESSAAGNDLTFLLADAGDWPKHLYEKLGFDTIGAIYDFALRR